MGGLTRSTCEVEGVERVYDFLTDIKVAWVKEKKKHPGADRLSLCQVDTGQDVRQIVCGAPNVQAGQVVPFADVGARLPMPDGEILEIKPAKIRGESSSGMLCSPNELGLTDFFGEVNGLLVLGAGSENGSAGKGKGKGFVFEPADTGVGGSILAELKSKFKPGASLASIFPLQDTVIEIDNKSITHRPDLWCHYGFAREIAAIFNRKIKFNPLAKSGITVTKSLGTKEVKIDKKAAKAYYGAYGQGVRVGPSPLWMRARLLSIGQRPINNIVDCSNYLMFEIGQPNHIFDAGNLKSETITVAPTGKTLAVSEFVTLDEEKTRNPRGDRFDS